MNAFIKRRQAGYDNQGVVGGRVGWNAGLQVGFAVLVLACLSVQARSDCQSAESIRIFGDLTQAEKLAATNGLDRELAKIEEARQTMKKAECSKLSLCYGEMAVVHVYLESNDLASGIAHLETVCTLSEQITPTEQRWDSEFSYKGLLLRLLLQADRVEKAQKLAEQIHSLSTAHGLDRLGLEDSLVKDATDAAAHDHLDRVKATMQAVRILAPKNVENH